MEQQLAIRESQEIKNIEDSAMSVEGLMRQVGLIQKVMGSVMREGEHYGTIPGTNKPTLLKSGAEKLCLTFRFDPDYEIIREVREKGFISYTVKCNIRHILSEQNVASGLGSCNSREDRYRYRYEDTGKPVPKEYWENRNPDVLGGPHFRPRQLKDDNGNPIKGKWNIFERVENDNPWNMDNTLIKMASKRALVAAVLNATAASDIFTQDVEDLVSNGVELGEEIKNKTKPNDNKGKSPIKSNGNKKKSSSIYERIYEYAGKRKISHDQMLEALKQNYKKEDGSEIESSKDISEEIVQKEILPDIVNGKYDDWKLEEESKS
jgi:hypothetical protein